MGRRARHAGKKSVIVFSAPDAGRQLGQDIKQKRGSGKDLIKAKGQSLVKIKGGLPLVEKELPLLAGMPDTEKRRKHVETMNSKKNGDDSNTGTLGKPIQGRSAGDVVS